MIQSQPLPAKWEKGWTLIQVAGGLDLSYNLQVSGFEWSRTVDLSVWKDPTTCASIAENGQAYQVIDDRPDA